MYEQLSCGNNPSPCKPAHERQSRPARRERSYKRLSRSVDRGQSRWYSLPAASSKERNNQKALEEPESSARRGTSDSECEAEVENASVSSSSMQGEVGRLENQKQLTVLYKLAKEYCAAFETGLLGTAETEAAAAVLEQLQKTDSEMASVGTGERRQGTIQTAQTQLQPQQPAVGSGGSAQRVCRPSISSPKQFGMNTQTRVNHRRVREISVDPLAPSQPQDRFTGDPPLTRPRRQISAPSGSGLVPTSFYPKDPVPPIGTGFTESPRIRNVLMSRKESFENAVRAYEKKCVSLKREWRSSDTSSMDLSRPNPTVMQLSSLLTKGLHRLLVQPGFSTSAEVNETATLRWMKSKSLEDVLICFLKVLSHFATRLVEIQNGPRKEYAEALAWLGTIVDATYQALFALQSNDLSLSSLLSDCENHSSVQNMAYSTNKGNKLDKNQLVIDYGSIFLDMDQVDDLLSRESCGPSDHVRANAANRNRLRSLGTSIRDKSQQLINLWGSVQEA